MIKQIFFLFFVLLIELSFLFSCDNQTVRPENNPSNSSDGNITEANLIFKWDFEDSNPMHDLGELTLNSSIVADPLNSSNKVMKCILPDDEYRTEVSVDNGVTPYYFYADNSNINNGDEFWVGVKILKNLEVYTGSNKAPSIFQIGPVNNPITYPGTASNGHYQLQLATITGSWKWREFNSIYNPGSASTEMASVNYVSWESFVFHCKFKSDNTGLIEIWRNGILIYSQTAQNGIAHDRTRIKWGIYTGSGNTSHEQLTCYYDNIKIGNCNSNYAEVAP